MWDFCCSARGWTPFPLHLECRVLTAGLPGKSQNHILKVKDEEKPGQPYTVGASVNWCNDFGNLPQYFLKLNIHIPLTSNSAPEYVPSGNECFCPPEGVGERVHSGCLHDHPLWKQLTSPAAAAGGNTCDVSTMKYYTAIKREQSMGSITTEANLISFWPKEIRCKRLYCVTPIIES